MSLNCKLSYNRGSLEPLTEEVQAAAFSPLVEKNPSYISTFLKRQENVLQEFLKDNTPTRYSNFGDAEGRVTTCSTKVRQVPRTAPIYLLRRRAVSHSDLAPPSAAVSVQRAPS